MAQIALFLVSAAAVFFLLTFLKALLSDSRGRGYGRRPISRRLRPLTGVALLRRDQKPLRTPFLPHR